MNPPSNTDISTYVSRCLELAILLEVSAYPKPGNVHRTADFPETKFEHFLASAVAVAPHFERAVERGVQTATDEIISSRIGLGTIIKNAVSSMCAWQSNGNTLLGAIILLAPLAVGAGMMFAQGEFSPSTLRKNVDVVVRTCTPIDAVNVYDAILEASPSGLGDAPNLDLNNPNSKKEILENEVSLFEVFQIAAEYDSIAYEWVHNYPITFDLGYPFFTQQLKENKDLNEAIVHTFLKVLATVPDTFIARKVGLKMAKTISRKAGAVLATGGLSTMSGRDAIQRFDQELRDPSHQLSPGTTADLTEAVLALSLLEGYRP